MTTAKKEVLPITYAHNDVIRLEILILKKNLPKLSSGIRTQAKFFPHCAKKVALRAEKFLKRFSSLQMKNTFIKTF